MFTQKNAFIPQQCWDKSGKYRLCGATRLDAGLSWPKRPLCAYYHTPALLTKAHSVAPTPLLSPHGFRLPSKVHSAICAMPQSHHLRLSVMFCCCLLLFLIGFAYVAIYHTIGFCCCQVIIFRNFSSLSQCHRNPMLYRLGQFLNHSPWQQGSVAAFFRQQEAFACHWIKTTVYL